ncbi:MarR family winged helix-turn-helix transcriptional regulator [Streptomyces sp. NPDC051567]|uniref:MarR family winged helix-turn-helix transcriptional regulator n=1 Tax=Streptomyces sp. NPDC051567 TaxID=3365660 RepID=UPI0037A72ED0
MGTEADTSPATPGAVPPAKAPAPAARIPGAPGPGPGAGAGAPGTAPAPAEDSVDRHIARWSGKVPFDVTVEEVITRIQLLAKHVSHGKDRALAETGLQASEFETMHRLASRGAPWRAPSAALAAELLLSPAGMTGRLDTLERSGLIRRLRTAPDRRRVEVELTEEGHRRWSEAMRWRGIADTEMVEPLDDAERAALAALLKRMLLHVETR